MEKQCPICKKMFTPGVNGLLNPVGCDACLGVERINSRYGDNVAWLPGENQKMMMPLNGDASYIIAREQARREAVGR